MSVDLFTFMFNLISTAGSGNGTQVSYFQENAFSSIIEYISLQLLNPAEK